MDDRLQREFIAEADEIIEMVLGDIQELRVRHTEGRARRELVGRIFRRVHTIKGTAAASELDITSCIAHEFESLLDEVRLGRRVIDGDVLDCFDDSALAISASLLAAASGEQPVMPEPLIERLRATARPRSESTIQVMRALDALPDDIAKALSDYERNRLKEAIEDGARLFVVRVSFDVASFDKRFRDMSEALNASGEIISTLPGIDASAPDRVIFRFVYATGRRLEVIVSEILPFGEIEVTSVEREDTPADTVTETIAPTIGAIQPQSITPVTAIVRVELSDLDSIVASTHELFTDTSRALDVAMKATYENDDRSDLETLSSRIRRQFQNLEERMIELRMVAIAQTLARAARAGRIASRASGKEIDFEIRGGEVRLDRSLVDSIADPLVHLIRNAVDHGIESKSERLRAGKTDRGKISIEAIAEGSRVRLRVSDDGFGIDPTEVTRVAVSRGLIGATVELSKEESLRMIFRPGFSTAETVSNLSGRGVGLDVVEHGIESAGGELHIWSEPGQGTTFELVVPTTLALVPSLVVQSGGHRYCIDVNHVLETDYVQRAQIEGDGATQSARWRDELMPLVYLRRLLGQPGNSGNGDDRLSIVITRIGHPRLGRLDWNTPNQRYAAVAVDGWEGQNDVLVRGLGRHASRWQGVTGATELPGGTVALVLDLPRLLEMNL